MKRASALALAFAAAGLAAGAAAAASPVNGSISGPVTAVSGKTFVVKTSLSPTGSSKVAVGAKTTLTEEVAAGRAALKKGACVTATGTTKGSTVVATRIALRPAVEGSCTGGFGGRGPGARPAGSRPRGGTGGGGTRPGGGFRPPAGFGFAVGQVTAVKGSTLTVKGFRGTQSVSVSAKTAISKTATVSAAAVKKSMCAFVFGTSADKGVTVQARSVALSNPVGGSCTFRRRAPGP